jgi:type 1 glutamine amidotransferase
MAKRILVLCGDQYHPAEPVLQGLRSAVPECDVEQAPNGNVHSIPDHFDALIIAKLNVTSPTDSTPWVDDDTDGAISDFVTSGKGCFIIHAGSAGYRETVSIRSITGGYFDQHPDACEVIYSAESENNLTSGFNSFTVHDEHYFVEIDDTVDCYLSSFSTHGSQPAGWTHSYGKGKVCVLTAGHFTEVWENQDFQTLLRNGIQWITNA